MRQRRARKGQAAIAVAAQEVRLDRAAGAIDRPIGWSPGTAAAGGDLVRLRRNLTVVCPKPAIHAFAASYRSRPRLRSQPPRSKLTPHPSPRLEKLLYLAGNDVYERFDPTRKTVGPIAVQNACSINSEIKGELLPGLGGRQRHDPTQSLIGEVFSVGLNLY
jgi:hypothetical protein